MVIYTKMVKFGVDTCTVHVNVLCKQGRLFVHGRSFVCMYAVFQDFQFFLMFRLMQSYLMTSVDRAQPPNRISFRVSTGLGL